MEKKSGLLKVSYSLPYSDVEARKVKAGVAVELSYTLEVQIGGQTAAGFMITGFCEDD